MNKVIITKNGAALNSPVGFEPDPRKDEAPSGELEASITDKPCKETFDAPIVSQYRPSVKEFETVRAQLALRAHTLTAKPHQSGLTLWEVGKWGQTRVFSHWNDVLAFRAQIGV
ncbi:hypothetical protein B9Z51_00640 [Limnohabitans sp. T6-5]|uniref:hypothetical protein n=1 Tax=Limnohabitans sp. T6-5 TaxID=1100724 RepID=UPI000D3AA7D8|nr:hypothetical protein [Limnohabitans sp. T6-5]PUE10893.1 hypothetical protein B9Z51_00640 [Limnohabitans sp. T6-5]